MATATLPPIARYIELPMPGHPLAGATSGRVQAHRLTLFDKIGDGWHSCHWCGKFVKWTNKGVHVPDALIVDHLDADIFNNGEDNLVPSCSHCNLDRLRLNGHPSVELGCPECGILFLAKTNVAGVPYRRYCARACVHAMQSREYRYKVDVDVVCIRCGQEFTTREGCRSRPTPQHCST